MNIRFLPLKVAFESTKAAIAETSIYTSEVTTLTKILLNIYLESGIFSDAISSGSTR